MTLQQDFSEFISSRFDAHSDYERRNLRSLKARRNQQEINLFSTLNDRQKELFNDWQELDVELQGKWEEQAYALGFVDGITIARNF